MALLFKILRSLVRGQDHRIGLLNLDNRECRLDNELINWRMRALESVLRQNNLSLPDEYWDKVPTFISESLEAIRREREELLKNA